MTAKRIGDHRIPLDGRGEAVLEALSVNEHFIDKFRAFVRGGCRKRGETQMGNMEKVRWDKTVKPEPPKVEVPQVACSKFGSQDGLIHRNGKPIRMCRPCATPKVYTQRQVADNSANVATTVVKVTRRLGVADAVQALRSMSAGEFLDLESGLQDAVRELHRAYRATQKEGEQS